MRWLVVLAALAVTGCGREEAKRDGSLNLRSAHFIKAYHSDPVFPDTLSIVLTETRRDCRELYELEPWERGVSVSIQLPVSGECQLVTGPTEPGPGCVATAQLIGPRPSGGSENFHSAPGEGRVVLHEIRDGSIRGALTATFSEVLATCVWGSSSETICTCMDGDGSTWTCSDPGHGRDCCWRDEPMIEVSATFEATHCYDFRICTFGNCSWLQCEEVAVDCDRACTKAVASCSSCTPELDCEGLAERCVSSCESWRSEGTAMAYLACFESSQSCEEFDECISASCEDPISGSGGGASVSPLPP